jgi:hypothetical protein
MTPETTEPLEATVPEQLAGVVMRAYERFLEGQRVPAKPHPYVYASAFRPCERRMVLELVKPDRQLPLAADVLAKFRRGNDRERDLLVDLIRIGRDAEIPFSLVNQQERFELKGRDGTVVIAGKVDARLEMAGVSMPLEVKSWAPSLVDRIETFDDLFENQWTRAGGFQLLSYLYGSNQPVGFLLLDRSGLPLLLPVELNPHLERMEEFLSRAERVVAHRNAGTLPDFHDDPAECKRCPFYGSTCNPPLSAKVAEVLVDPELEAHLERWHSLKPAGKEFEALDADLKRHLRGVEAAIVGPFVISGKWGKQSRLELPPDLKKHYTKSVDRGRFSLEIQRIG